MKKLKYLLGVATVAMLFACKKDTTDAPTFDVATNRTEFNVADSVEFNISGYADVIGFYSGESGKEYKFRDRTEATDAKLQLNVSTRVLYGVQDNLALLYSTDFDNTYTPAGIAVAKWTDITSRFTLSTAAPSAVGAITPSGDVDLSDIVVPGKPIYFAWRYLGQPSATSAQGGRTWRIHEFNLSKKLTNGAVVSVVNVNSASWLGVDVKNPANAWTVQTGVPPLYFAPAGTVLESEDWAVSRALFPNAVKPDAAIGIKAFTDPIANYKYKFDAAGTYTVTFVAKNATPNEVKEEIKELTITIK